MKRLFLFNSNRPVETLAYWRRENMLLLDAPYQRGDVWGPIRQRNLIRSILMGVPIPSLIVNDRSRTSDEFVIAVVDGKQRITAILKFMDGDLTVPGEWFDMNADEVRYSDLPIARQRGFRNIPIAVAEGGLPESREAELFELVNFGGVPQGQTDLPTEP